jgi:uncharacterized membrane protein
MAARGKSNMLFAAAPHDSGAEPVTFTGVMEHVAQAFEALGALILVIGVLWSLWAAIAAWRRTQQPASGYAALRRSFGRTLLLGLEVLVAADLIRTVAVSPTLENVLVLGLIVLIRTFLSFSLEIEIEGVPPWRRAALRGAGTRGTAAPAPTTATTQNAPGEAPDDAAS